MIASDLPLWVTVPGSLLLVVAGIAALTASLGLLRLPTFYARMHAPVLAAILGTACMALTSMLVSTATLDRPAARELLIVVLIVVTTPVTSMLLMRAAIYRNAIRGSKDET
jgi:multicomponent K+:H+ antiporter subunit G